MMKDGNAGNWNEQKDRFKKFLDCGEVRRYVKLLAHARVYILSFAMLSNTLQFYIATANIHFIHYRTHNEETSSSLWLWQNNRRIFCW